MAELWSILVGWLPLWVQTFIFVLVSIVFLVLLIKIVGAVLNAIPFI